MRCSRRGSTKTTRSWRCRCCGGRRAAAVHPGARAVSAWFTLNIVFYGITDDGRFDLPRSFAVIDATLLVAVLGCVSLAWFAKVLYAECCQE